jgi:hypothetical protein
VDIRIDAKKKYDNLRKNYPSCERHFRALPVHHDGTSSFVTRWFIKMNTSKDETSRVEEKGHKRLD